MQSPSNQINKVDVINRIAAKRPDLTEDQVSNIVNLMVDQMISSLASGERIEIRGFGSFKLHVYEPRQGRNPKTGQIVQVPVRRVPRFKAGSILSKKIDAGVSGE